MDVIIVKVLQKEAIDIDGWQPVLIGWKIVNSGRATRRGDSQKRWFVAWMRILS